jgi:hypothetical protein
MLNTKHTAQSIQPGGDGIIAVPAEISCVFRFGKHHQQDPCLKQPENDPIINMAALSAAFVHVHNQLKISPSLQVHSFDGSLISVFNSETAPTTTSPTYTNLETSFDLPVGDSSFIQQILDQTRLSPELPEFDLSEDIFKDIFDSSSSFEPTQTSELDMIIETTVASPEHLETFHTYEQSNSAASVVDESMLEKTISSPLSCMSDGKEGHHTNERQTNTGSSAARRLARFGNKQVIKYSDEYHDRRLKNNEAVKKSRMKAKEKQQSSKTQMDQLAAENRLLNDRVELLMKELQIFRSLYKELKHNLPGNKVQLTTQVTNTH